MIPTADIKSYWNEKWQKITFDNIENPPHYEVSDHGRICSYSANSPKGKIIKGSVIQGYRSLNLRLKGGQTVNHYIHKLVAVFFLEPLSESQKYIIHLDFDKQNNRVENLQWVTKDEMVAHNRTNPAVVNRVIPRQTKNYKLNDSKVLMIKRLLKSDKSRHKMIAKQFGITHTQLNRIKTGENWKHVSLQDDV
jgi:NUMOD4 motif/HNH endonuclease